MKIIKNDTVLIIAGNYNGKRGRVLKVFPSKNRIIVEGVNFIKRHTKKSTKNPTGGIIEKEAPINVSNAMVICSKCGQPTRVGRMAIKEDDRVIRVRTCTKCSEVM